MPRTDPVHQVRDGRQAVGGKRDSGPPRSSRTGQAPPRQSAGWHREQLPDLVAKVDPARAPVLPADHELEVPP